MDLDNMSCPFDGTDLNVMNHAEISFCDTRIEQAILHLCNDCANFFVLMKYQTYEGSNLYDRPPVCPICKKVSEKKTFVWE